MEKNKRKEKHQAKNDKHQINKTARTTKGNIYSKGQRSETKCKTDRRTFVDNLAHEAEQAASHGVMSTVYKITNQLCGKTTRQPARIKDTNGNPLSTEQEQAKRWVQYFQDVLNCPEAGEPASPDPAEEDLDINIETPTIEEIKYAIKTLKIANHQA